MSYHNRRNGAREKHYPDAWKQTTGDRKRPLEQSRTEWRRAKRACRILKAEVARREAQSVLATL
jgi:hypothetical protein